VPRAALVALLMLLTVPPALAQGRRSGPPPVNLSAPPAAPTAGTPRPPPRSAAGRIDIESAGPGGKGIWMSLFPGGVVAHLTPLETVPFQPWARRLYDERLAHQLEPHARCKPSGSVRQMQTPYGVEIVDRPELQRVYIFDIGGPHSYREVFMDGRTHPRSLLPSAYGHSIGWWEGDTLVVDTVGYNEGFWIDRRGLPATDRLHTLERFTRRLHDTMSYEITIDDPGAYTQPFSGRFDLRLDPANGLFEYVCQEANHAVGLMLGTAAGGGSEGPVGGPEGPPLRSGPRSVVATTPIVP
jgi:hypothetical protein